jgi:hypothetical protein
MRVMASSRVPALPPDGGASFVAGYGSAEVAVAALGVFLVFYVVATITSKSWPFDIAFLALVAGGLLVSWPVMILLTGAAVVLAVVVGFVRQAIVPDRRS